MRYYALESAQAVFNMKNNIKGKINMLKNLLQNW